MYKHYIRTNEAGIIIHGFSDAFEQPQDGDILIYEGDQRHFHLIWTESLVNERGQYLWRWIDGEKIERTQVELDAEWATRPLEPKSETELLRDRVDELTVLLGDVILGGGAL